MESGKVFKERLENFINNGGTLEQFTQLYLTNEGNEDTLKDELTTMIWGEGTIFDKIGRGIENLWKAVVNFFSGFGTFIGNIISAIGEGIAAVCTAIGNIVGGIVNGILNGIGAVLQALFVPQNNPFEQLSQKINTKFGFVNQIKDLFSSLLGFNNYGNSVPTFTLTWFNTTVGIIDFSLFLQYRDWIHGIILAIAWTVFILKTYRKLPNIIGGYSE